MRVALLSVVLVLAVCVTPTVAAQAPAASSPATPPQAPAVTPPPAVPPLIAAQVEAYELREQLYVQTLQLARERIDAAVAASLPGWRVDWQAKRLVPVEAPAPKATP